MDARNVPIIWIPVHKQFSVEGEVVVDLLGLVVLLVKLEA